MKNKVITAQQAAELIKDGATVCTIGMTLIGAAESVLKALEKRFLETGSPCDLTYIHSAGQSNRDRGNQHFVHHGMVKRIIGSHWGWHPSGWSALPPIALRLSACLRDKSCTFMLPWPLVSPAIYPRLA